MLKQSLEELKNQLRRQLPPEAKVSEIEFEGPFLVVYAARPDVLMEDGHTIKNLAKTLRKRIVIRSDPSVRMDKESAEIEIKNIVPEEAGISSCSFDDTLGEVVIESKKPGLVIGQNGSTLREITKRVFWRPTVLRTPPIESNLIANIRHILQKESSERKRILVNIGRRIHRHSVSMAETGWIRITGLGGCGEVGRSCILIETKESKILVDCGVNVGRTEPYAMFPQFNAPEFDIGQLDAVVITHAHLDHCFPPDTPIQLANGQWKPIQDVNEGEPIMSMNWRTGELEPATCVGKTITHGHKEVIEITTPYLNIVSSPNHRFFTVKNMEIVEVEAQDLEKHMLLPAQHNPFSSKNNKPILLDRTIDYQGTFSLTQEMRTDLRKHRLDGNLKQSEVASEVGIHPNAVSSIETKQENVTFPVLKSLVDLYGVSWEEFVDKHDLPRLPQILTSELARLVGYIQGDGHKSGDHSFRITEPNTTVVKTYSELIKDLFGIEPIVRSRKDTETPTFFIEVNNAYILRFLELNFSTIFSKSRTIDLPNILENASNIILNSYIRGLFDAEGSVVIDSSQEIKFCTFSSKLLKRLQVILYRLGIPSSLYVPDFNLSIRTSQAIIKFAKLIGFTSPQKALKLQKLVEIANSTSEYRLRNLVPISSDDVKRILKEVGIVGRAHKSPKLSNLPMGILDLYRRGSGYGTKKTIISFIELLNSRYESLELLKEELGENLLLVRQQLSIPRVDLASSTGLSMMEVQYREEKHCLKDEKTESIRSFLANQIIYIQEYITNVIEKIHYLLSLDVEWQRITRIEKYQNNSPLIDIEVSPNRNFIANNLIVHNSGFLPFLFKYGYRGPVYCNEATRSLMTLLQNDYLQIATMEGKLLPFNSNDIRTAILHTIPRRYGEVTDLSPDVRLTLSPAGHILGSSIVHFHMGDGRFNLAVAHDFKFARSRLLSPANVNFPRLEALIMESTYGGTKDIMPSRKEAERQLVRIINQTVRGGGKVLIPTLAVGRAQELLVVMDKYIRNGELEETPIYLDGMISEATAIHTCHPEYLSQELQNRIFNTGQNPFLSEYFVQVENSKHREEIEEGSPSVILATSGMLTGGPSVEYFQHLAGSEKHSIVFVSYQAEKTLGKRIQSGAKEIRMFRRGKMDLIRVNMDVHTVQGFSGHADRRELMNYVQKLSPKPMKILCVHGQRNKSESLASSIEKRFHIETQVPQNLESIRFI